MKSIKFDKIFKGFSIFCIFYLSSLFIFIPKVLFNINFSNVADLARLKILLSVFCSLMFSIVVLICYWKDIVKEFKIFKDKLIDNINVGFTCWITGLIVMAVSNIILFYLLNSGGANNENSVRLMTRIFPLAMGLDICILAPFNEEFVYRKVFYDVFKNKQLFVIISFLIFGLAHVSSMATKFTDWLYIIPYGAFGATFAYAYSKTDSIFTSMLFHVIHNTILFITIIL